MFDLAADPTFGEPMVSAEPWPCETAIPDAREHSDHQVIPKGLDQMEPGPYLAAILSSVEVSRLSGYDRVVVLRARQRMASHFQAGVLEAMVSIEDAVRADGDSGLDEELTFDGAAAEIRAALSLTRRSAEYELGFATGLCQRLPRVWNRLRDGVIDPRRARVIAAETTHLPEAEARRVADAILKDVSDLTTGQIRVV